MPKFTLEEVKAIKPERLMKMIDRARSYLKKDKTMQGIIKEYGADIEQIDLIPIFFKDLDVSATTDHGIVYLNYALLCDGDFLKDIGYLVHEATHFFQQCFQDKPTQGADDGEYLDNPYEVEGFQNQIEWIAENFGGVDADKYVEKMLDHHELKGKEKKDKKEELTKNVEE